MKRSIPLIALTCLALLAPAAASASAPASARKLHCGAAAGTRLPAADFEGRMQAVSGTQRMSMRFEIQERIGKSPWSRAKSPALRWRRSAAGVRQFSFVQRVENLRLEGDYRVRVEFRWMGRGGRVLRSASRSSDSCPALEPFPAAELAGRAAGAVPAHPRGIASSRRYIATRE